MGLTGLPDLIGAVGQARKAPRSDMLSAKIAFGSDGAVTLDGVIFGARGILLLAPPGCDGRSPHS